MKTMYRAECGVYEDVAYGRGREFKMCGDYQQTMEDAKALVVNTKPDMIHNGDYRVVAVTMDEATFTYKEEVVFDFDYFAEVAWWKNVDRNIDFCKKAIEDINKSIARSRSEKSIARKQADLAYQEKELKHWENEKAKRGA